MFTVCLPSSVYSMTRLVTHGSHKMLYVSLSKIDGLHIFVMAFSSNLQRKKKKKSYPGNCVVYIEQSNCIVHTFSKLVKPLKIYEHII